MGRTYWVHHHFLAGAKTLLDLLETETFAEHAGRLALLRESVSWKPERTRVVHTRGDRSVRKSKLILATLVLASAGTATIAAADAVPDTVRLAAGTFDLRIIKDDGRNLTVLGAGAGATIIRPANPDSAPSSAIFGEGAQLGQLTVRGVTFENWRGSVGELGSLWGGAIAWGPNGVAEGVVIEDCAFRGNQAARTGLGTYGGALACARCYSVVVRNSAFEEDAGDKGGEIYLLEVTTATIDGSTFSHSDANWSGEGLALYAASCGRVDLTQCEFESDAVGESDGSGVELHADHVVVAKCSFRDAGDPRLSRIWVEGSPGGVVEFKDNVVWCDSPWAGWAVQVFGHDECDVSMEGNTLSGTNLSCSARLTDAMVVTHNILQRADVDLSSISARGEIGCNCWEAQRVLFRVPSEMVHPTNVSGSPLFCDESGGDLTLHANSPCSPDSSSCGRIGALDVGCAATSVRETTWGQVKRHFLGR